VSVHFTDVKQEVIAEQMAQLFDLDDDDLDIQVDATVAADALKAV